VCVRLSQSVSQAMEKDFIKVKFITASPLVLNVAGPMTIIIVNDRSAGLIFSFSLVIMFSIYERIVCLSQWDYLAEYSKPSEHACELYYYYYY